VLPRAPVELERTVAWCLVADPAERPQSMAALLPVLNGLIRSGPRMWPQDLVPERAAPRDGDERQPEHRPSPS
jgi:hypothetical protein